MDSAVETEFLDLLYEAALEPDRWIPAMDRLADLVGGTSSWLSRLSMADGTGTGVVSRIDPVMPPLYYGYYAPQNLYSNATDPEAFMRGWTPKIMLDEDCVPKEELVKTEYYDGFLKPQDVHSIMFVRLAARGVEISAISINRPESWGRFESAQVERARRLHPHVRRAFRVAETLAEAGLVAEGMSAAMDRSPCGVILLDDAGRIRRTNAVAEARLAEAGGFCVIGGRLSAAQSKAANELQALISVGPRRTCRCAAAAR